MTHESILLVDDDPIFLRAVACALAAAGHPVETATSSMQAFQRATTTPYAVVVASLAMGDGAGETLIRELACVVPQTECIVLAAPSSIERLTALYDLNNLYNHLWKPLEDMGALARDVGRALERRALKRQNAYLLAELRDARDAVRSQAEILVQAEKLAALGQMVSGLAGGLEQPLADLAGGVDALRRALMMRGPNQQQRLAACARSIEETLKGCRALTQRIRRFSEGTCGTLRPTDLHDVLDEAFALVRPALQERAVKLFLDYAPDLPPVPADSVALEQALLHVALNALHAMPDGGLLVVSTEAVPGDPGGVRVQMRDTGVGIEPEVLPHIFEPFFTTRPFGKGTGLGLAITRDILRDHGADITLETAVGRGTTVTLTFPTAAAVAPPEQVLQLAA